MSATMETPLLRGFISPLNRAWESSVSIDQMLAGSKPSDASQGAVAEDLAAPKQDNGVDLRFLYRLWRLMGLARAQGALLLGALSVLEVLVVAQVGVMPGLFYKALLDNDIKLFATAMWRSLLWYGSAALCCGVKLGVSEMLALQWRKRLTLAAHSCYCRDSNVFYLMKDGAVDNPDQRVAQEIQLFSTGLAQLLHKTVVSPLMIAYYTALVWSYVGWTGPLAIYLFFSVGTLGARCLISPIAALVAQQEKLEGDFRVAHVRLRTTSEQVALCASSPVERTALDRDLTRVLTNQRSLVIRHTILELGSKAYDYSGMILNYAILALPIFVGIYGKGAAVDKGAIAQLVSNASFAVLTLIYSFTQLIDAAKVLSDVAGVTGRVAGLFEALERMGGAEGEPAAQPDTKRSPPKQGPSEKESLAHFLAQSVALTPSLPGVNDSFPATQFENLYPWMHSLPNPIAPIREGSPNGLLLGPLTSSFGRGSLELTVHSVPPELQGVLQEVFSEQGAPGLWTQPLLVVPTFQCARVDLWDGTTRDGSKADLLKRVLGEPGSVLGRAMGSEGEESDKETVSEEMARLADVFLTWQAVVCGVLRAQGFWAAAVDPRTGFALPSAVAQSARLRDRLGSEAVEEATQSADAAVLEAGILGGQESVSGETRIVDAQENGNSVVEVSQVRSPGISSDLSQSNPVFPEILSAPAPTGPSNGNRLHITTAITARPSCRKAAPARCPSDDAPAAYSEVHGAKVLLGYEIGTAGACPVVFHPRFGQRAYPASLFTNAPLEALSEAIVTARPLDVGTVPPSEVGINGMVSPAVDAGITSSTAGVSDRVKAEVSGGASAPVLEVCSLTVRTPGGVSVVSGLDLRIGVRERVMLMGPSGCGKTTLVRTIAGLWPQVGGSIRSEPPSGGAGTLFLPQTPLLARGGLAAQLAYPREVPAFTEVVEGRMGAALKVVELEGLLHRVNGNWKREEDWPAILSPGEQQRLSLARVLFHWPRLAILDEATSAIGEPLEARIYARFALLETSFLTISHRHTLKKWHSHVVYIAGDGTGAWTRDQLQ